MPGVADRVRKTQLLQEREQRREETQEVLNLIKENRLHEADDRQIDLIKTSMEITTTINEAKIAGRRSHDLQSQLDKLGDLENLINNAVRSALSGVVQGGGSAVSSPPSDPQRPKMEHISIADIQIAQEPVSLTNSTSLGETVVNDSEATDKLEQLRRLKGKQA